MAYDKFYIGYLDENTGYTTNVKPYAIPDNAYAVLNNVYSFRGRIRKRWGTYPMSSPLDGILRIPHTRLGMIIGTTDGAGNIAGTIPGAQYNIRPQFIIDNEIFTVYQVGTPADMLTTGAATVYTYNTNTGAFVINGSAINTNVYFYPGLPVMGLPLYEQGQVFGNPTIGFDTQFSYIFNGANWERLGNAVWTGDNSQFFWTTTYRGATPSEKYLFVSNYNNIPTNTGDPIRYYDGATWNDFTPIVDNAANIVTTALCITQYYNRLLLFNTVETTGIYLNRIRYSQNGNSLAANAWNQNIPGSGNFIDATTSEPIVSIEFIKDRLMVYFADSTYELVYTNNEIIPFRLQKINTELGGESTFSVVPFDKAILNIGKTGIQACNGVNVERIDVKIPQEVFDIHIYAQGVRRVYGIRDFFTELVYWTFPSVLSDSTYPDRILIYNYINDSWALFNDTITCFGYYENTHQVFNLSPEYRQVLAGNQQGYVNIIDSDTYQNAFNLQISNITYLGNIATLTIYNHNLGIDYILIDECQGITDINNEIFKVQSIIDINTITIITDMPLVGVYTGGGYVATVSQINIISKEYNFYKEQDRNVYIKRIDCFITATNTGEITFDTWPSSTTLSLIEQGTNTGAILGTGVLDTYPYPLVPLESLQERLWHPVYPQAEGTSVTFNIYLSDQQMLDNNISLENFELHAMVIHAMPTRYGMI